ncbi:helix-turn-helix domain-containing protein [Vagococcus sp. CY52-2]|uniref:helix-turn-helix domain-containing protein n=1 Tax=Vagococcus sp. CY52-2 TaxID=2925838 RepID=UPI001F599590|nr:AraC family transcriptional regulator [Vagococcus sp. CY52-2]UNM90186.1 AraC family transcriptional regulator [Vagococcus sp. CY52-2]
MNYSHYIKRAISYIQQHLNKDLTLTIISDYIGYSSYRFHRLFKKETGLSLYDYIQQQRLIQASMLLKYTNLSINHIFPITTFSLHE